MSYTTPTTQTTNLKKFRLHFHRGDVEDIIGTSISEAWRERGYVMSSIELLKEWKEIPYQSTFTKVHPEIEEELLKKQKIEETIMNSKRKVSELLVDGKIRPNE